MRNAKVSKMTTHSVQNMPISMINARDIIRIRVGFRAGLVLSFSHFRTFAFSHFCIYLFHNDKKWYITLRGLLSFYVTPGKCTFIHP